MASTVHDTLRQATWDIHERLEATPYAKALEDGSVSLEGYLGHLRCLAVLHSELERHLSKVADHPVWRPEDSRLPLIMADLDFFRPRFARDVLPAVEEALAMAGDIRRRCRTAPASLLGPLYVLEGSAKGGLTLAPLVRAALDLPEGRGATYLESRGPAVPARFEAFMERMEAALGADEALLAQAVESAREFFEGLERIMLALHPLRPEALGFHVTGLNPEAGMHAVPADAQELAAAVCAGERCLVAYPYFERRYGQRGRRFTASDSAWLVTVGRLSPQDCLKQVEWLAGVLAARGMPRVLMERHLEFLAEELNAARPELAASHAALRSAARELERLRLEKMPLELARTLTAGFQAATAGAFAPGPDGTRPGEPLAEAAELILSAVADEAWGVAGAVESLSAWLAGREVFPEAWCLAVEELVAKARGAVAG